MVETEIKPPHRHETFAAECDPPWERYDSNPDSPAPFINETSFQLTHSNMLSQNAAQRSVLSWRIVAASISYRGKRGATNPTVRLPRRRASLDQRSAQPLCLG